MCSTDLIKSPTFIQCKFFNLNKTHFVFQILGRNCCITKICVPALIRVVLINESVWISCGYVDLTFIYNVYIFVSILWHLRCIVLIVIQSWLSLGKIEINVNEKAFMWMKRCWVWVLKYFVNIFCNFQLYSSFIFLLIIT